MLKQIFSYSLLTVMLVIQGALLEARLPSENEQVDSNFDIKLNDAVSKQQQLVQNLKANATRKDMAPTWNSKLELENAMIQLEVKKTLVGNFTGSESLKSSLVRNRLLEVLNKPMITTTDLADLQSLVLEEKARMRKEAQNRETQSIEVQKRTVDVQSQ